MARDLAMHDDNFTFTFIYIQPPKC